MGGPDGPEPADEGLLASSTWLNLILGIVFPLVFGLVMQRVRRQPSGVLPGKRILLVTAHPDDEAMFFGPMLLSRHAGQQISLLCLSTGNADGQGETRVKELAAAAKWVGIRPESVYVEDHPDLQDGMATKWPSETIEEIVLQTMKAAGTETLVTFDEHGVSGHINHIAVANALRTACKAGRLWNQQKLHKPAKLFQLKSTGVIRKHLGVLDVFFSFSDPHFFLMPSGGFIHIWKTMQCHASQFVWYRKVFMATSRFSYINTLAEVKIPSQVLAAAAMNRPECIAAAANARAAPSKQQGKGSRANSGGGPQKRSSSKKK